MTLRTPAQPLVCRLPQAAARLRPERRVLSGKSARLRSVAMAATLLLALGTPGCRGPEALPGYADKQRGVCFEFSWPPREGKGYGSPASAGTLARLKELGVDWISITPFGFLRTTGDTAVRWGARRIVETDSSLIAVTAQAHALGIHVMLKPHLWLRPPLWVGDVEMRSAADWHAWFESYSGFILHYAELAEHNGMEGLVIGNELAKASARERDWRAIIRRIRRSYHGLLTYGAAMEEVFTVPFWDDLDFIGVSGYYPLVDQPSPPAASLIAAWQPIGERLGALSARVGKKIVFTELGYRSADAAAWRQWEVPDTARVNVQLQADAYRAFFEAVWSKSWCAGVYWWKWPSSGEKGRANDYPPVGKPAEEVLRHFFLQGPAGAPPGPKVRPEASTDTRRLRSSPALK